MIYQFNVANIRSDCCAYTICAPFGNFDGVNETDVNITNGAVFVDAINGIKDTLTAALLHLGYPEAEGSKLTNTLSVIAKSIDSCIKGRLQSLI